MTGLGTKPFSMIRRVNWLMLLVVGLLLVIGVMFVYSACFISEEKPVRALYVKQAMWALAGVVCYAGLAAMNYRMLGKLAWWLYGISLVLLVLVLLIAEQTYGAQRRLDLLGVSIQPSEMAKLATILVLARELGHPGPQSRSLRSLIAMLAIIVVPVALIMKQPDLGTSMVFLPTAFIMMLVAGVHVRPLMVLALVGLLGVGTILGAATLPMKLGMPKDEQLRIWKMTTLSEYQRRRILVFVGMDEDPLGAGWNKRQSEIAVGSGGTWGKGFTKGTQNILGFLPRSVAPTDFIFSVIAEETGFVGSVVVLSLFGLLVTLAMLAAVHARDRMGRLLCAGVATLLFCHIFINIAMTVGLMPITGLPLPLLSYGGSFMVVVMSALGIVESVRLRSLMVDRDIG